jgi:hypothetical protein
VFYFLTIQMVPPTRRHLLQVAAAVAAGGAGCSGLIGEESSSSRSVSEGTGAAIPGGDTDADPPAVLLRAKTPPLRLSGSDRTPAEPESTRRSPRPSHIVLDTKTRAEELVVAEDAPEADVSSFVSATEFESETLYFETRSVEECFRLRLCEIAWTASEIQTGYVRQIRPYDERCSADEQVFESRLIRIPAALDRDEIDSYGTSISGSSRCDGGRPTDTDGTGGNGSTATAGGRGDGGAE